MPTLRVCDSFGDAPIGCVPLSARGFAGQREVPCHRWRGVRRDPISDRLDDEGSVVPHRHVPDARQDPELRVRDLSLEALSAGREREDPIELPPSDERWRGDLIEVLDTIEKRLQRNLAGPGTHPVWRALSERPMPTTK